MLNGETQNRGIVKINGEHFILYFWMIIVKGLYIRDLFELLRKNLVNSICELKTYPRFIL